VELPDATVLESIADRTVQHLDKMRVRDVMSAGPLVLNVILGRSLT
jgi:hypothetical protein